jgi:hypothetical protein
MNWLENWLPEHKCGLHIFHNPHKDYYETVEEYFIDYSSKFISPEERELSIQTDELWEIRWYPDTPVGFCYVHAASLMALKEYFENER